MTLRSTIAGFRHLVICHIPRFDHLGGMKILWGFILGAVLKKSGDRCNGELPLASSSASRTADAVGFGDWTLLALKDVAPGAAAIGTFDTGSGHVIIETGMGGERVPDELGSIC